MPVTLQALVGPADDPLATGPVVPCLAPGDGDAARLGPLWDVPDHLPAYLADPLPLPPRVPRPEPAAGRIVWPCWGLSRPAAGHLIVSAAGLAALADLSAYVAAEWDGRVKLTLDDGAGTPAELRMRVAAARPLADARDPISAAPPSDPAAYLLTLADARWERAGVPVPGDGSAPATWGDLLSALILAATGQTVPASGINALLAAYSPAYPAPPAGRWANAATRGRTAAVVADAAAAAVNLRLAVAGDGSVSVQDANAADAVWGNWLDGYGGRFESGGLVDGGREKPKAVVCRFSPTVVIQTTFAGSRRGVVSADLYPSASDADWAARYTADAGRWLSLAWPAGEGWGWPPPPASGVPFDIAYDAVRGGFRLHRAPVWHPWPLAGSPLPPPPPPPFVLNTRNLDGTEAGTTDDLRADQGTGVEFDQSPGGASYDVIRARLAGVAQRGVWGVEGDGANGLQTFGGRKLLLGRTWGVTSDPDAVDYLVPSVGAPYGFGQSVYSDDTAGAVPPLAVGVFSHAFGAGEIADGGVGNHRVVGRNADGGVSVVLTSSQGSVAYTSWTVPDTPYASGVLVQMGSTGAGASFAAGEASSGYGVVGVGATATEAGLTFADDGDYSLYIAAAEWVPSVFSTYYVRTRRDLVAGDCKRFGVRRDDAGPGPFRDVMGLDIDLDIGSHVLMFRGGLFVGYRVVTGGTPGPPVYPAAACLTMPTGPAPE